MNLKYFTRSCLDNDSSPSITKADLLTLRRQMPPLKLPSPWAEKAPRDLAFPLKEILISSFLSYSKEPYFAPLYFPVSFYFSSAYDSPPSESYPWCSQPYTDLSARSSAAKSNSSSSPTPATAPAQSHADQAQCP